MGTRTIRQGVTFREEAASSWERVEKARGQAMQVTRSTVSWDEQQGVYDELGSPAALPPEYSNHVYKDDDNGGNAVDTDDHQYLRDNPDHGWEFPHDNIGEWWHAEYNRNKDKHRNETPKPVKEKDEEMPYILSSPAGQTFVTGSVAVNFPSSNDVKGTTGCDIVKTTADMHNRILKTLKDANK